MYVCEGECLDTAPVKVSGDAALICFNYTSSVDAVVGFADSEFDTIYWLNRSGSDCSVAMVGSMVLDFSSTMSCEVELPDDVLDGGVVFWFVSPVSFENVDWDNGPFEIGYYIVSD
jgi:hypothetical protein